MRPISAVAALTLGYYSRMRYVLVAAALALVVGCHHGPKESTPTNKAPTPDYSKAADDVLGFLPADADFVLGVDMVHLRASPLWQKYEPHLVKFVKEQFDKLGGWCGEDPAVAIKKVERVTGAIKAVGSNKVKGVLVVRGLDPGPSLECMVTQTQKHGGTATRDRGVVVVSYPQSPGEQVAFGAAGPTTAVMQFDQVVSHDSLTALLVAGTPLRSSQAFMTLFNRREPTAAMWGMANGNAKVFDELAQIGRPKSLDGTLTVTDKFSFVVRMTMASPDEAARLGAEIDKAKAMAGAFVERFESRIEGTLVSINVVMTEAQVLNILKMLGGAMGGP